MAPGGKTPLICHPSAEGAPLDDARGLAGRRTLTAEAMDSLADSLDGCGRKILRATGLCPLLAFLVLLVLTVVDLLDSGMGTSSLSGLIMIGSLLPDATAPTPCEGCVGGDPEAW